MQRRRGPQGVGPASPKFEIVRLGHCFKERNPLLVILGNCANEGYVDVAFGNGRQHVENIRLERQMIDFGAYAKTPKELRRR